MGLTLSRKIGESVLMGEDIRVTVTEIRGSHVRLTFDAPASIKILRQEVHDEIQAERAAKLTATEQAVANVAPTMDERAKRKGRAS